ncbi:hypothetical protein FNV43_RR08965 [Rhamnella rubrinervis]|uniref:Uncharacterized protein n=1 Tax=Rhamnella rubrinervis TaxID=2594499 RepID=A0A8K0MJJ1_9ROSA|nr:hypothetical protein FNV43_RR08965 [Rhamnella rubrinervis]
MERNDGGGGDGEDNFGGVLPFCHVSTSQEDYFHRCPFAPEASNPAADDDSSESDDGIPVESNGIVMVSPPESLELRDNSTPQDVFQTPPEYSTMLSSEEQHPPVAVGNREQNRSEEGARDCGGETAVVDMGCEDDTGLGMVELGVDSGLGFLETELTQRVVHAQSIADPSRRNVPGSKSLEFQVSEEGFHESPLKKSKTSNQNSAESTQESESGRVVPYNHGSDSRRNHESSESQAKRKLEFQPEMEANDGTANEGIGEVNELQSSGQEKVSVREFMETVDMPQHVSTGDMGATVDEHERCQRRVLPSSICGHAESENENTAKRVQSGGLSSEEGHRKFTILDALKILENVSNESVPTDGFLEICKRRGVTFPRPSWRHNR